MIYLIFILLLILYTVTAINTIFLMYLYKNKKEQKNENLVKNKRIHTSIKTSNYDNSYGNRGYDMYKNKNGLYEPQKPHKGIELKKEE